MTNFTYNSSIPASDHNPSADQPIMQTNALSIAGLVAVDHVGFGVNNGGQHTQITFNQDASYVPTNFPVNPPELFTNTVSGIPQLFFYSGSQANSANQYTIASNGSIVLFGGIIMKWAIVTADSTSKTLASLGLNDFPNAVYGAVASIYGHFNGNVVVYDFSASSITLVASAGSPPCFVIMIGR